MRGGAGMWTALSWGQRFTAAGKWPTVEATLIDIDGDGLLDRVTNDPITETIGGSTYTVKCGMSWERNPGGGAQFETVPHPHIDLPTLKWGSPASDVYAGGEHSNINGTDNELCALNYQQTSYVNSHGNAGVDLGCPPSSWGACPLGYCTSAGSYGNDCGKKNGNPTTILAYRWIDMDDDGKVDLVASIAQGGLGQYNLQWGNGVPGHLPAPQEQPPVFGTFPWCPAAPYSDGSANNNAYTMCNGMYPWFVYTNHGGGVFGTHQGTTMLPSKILYQPMPLETTTGDSAIAGRVVGAQNANVDLDGDGHSDEVDSRTAASGWSVYRGGTAYDHAFQPASAFTVGSADTTINVSTTVTYGPTQPISTVGLFDLNGDGLPDRWSGTGATASFEMNAGYGFIQSPLTSARRPGNDGRILGSNCSDVSGFNGFFSDCIRFDSSRTVDVDGDGRGDLVQLPGTCLNGTSCVTNADCGVGNTCANATYFPGVYFNEGGQFSTSPVTAGVATALDHKMESSSQSGGLGINPYTWAVRSDMIDLDGDGIAEGITTFGSPPTFVVSRVSASAPAPRLLSQIDNGQGAQTQISYAPLSNSAVVTQDWQNGKVSPHSQWVVSSLTTVDQVDVPATTSTSTMTYKNPIFNPDDLGHYGLRGFEEATTTRNSGAKTVERYDYMVDWRGARNKTLEFSAETPLSPTRIDATTWEARQLFSNKLTTYHAVQSEHLICAAGQTETTCTPASAAGYSRTTSVLSACGYIGSAGSCNPGTMTDMNSMLWAVTRTLEQAGTVAADGDRRSTSELAVMAPPGSLDYRVQSLSVTREWQVGGAFAMYAKSAHTWDAAYKVPVTDEQWVDANNDHRAVARTQYDPLTGNPTFHWKPNQNATNGPSSRYDYDSRQLFVAAEHSEPAGYYNLSQELDYTYDYGTGTKIDTIGPNTAACAHSNPTCPTGTTSHEETRVQVDGLGRVVDRWATQGQSFQSAYTLFERERNTYHDSMPVSVTTQVAFDVDASQQPRFTKSITDLDGHGRAVQKAEIIQAPQGLTNAVTTFTYDNNGELSAVAIPDPSSNSEATVTYTYTYDSLGRPRSMRRPDSMTPGLQSGMDVVYSGLSTTQTEFVGVAGGQQASTTSTKDSFGRLVAVQEVVIGTTLATTSYSYDASNNVTQVVDPTGATVTMAHDFAGHRTEVTRGASTWRFTYDLNGNVTSESFPGSTGGAQPDPRYVNTTAYDNLDRPTSRMFGARDLDSADKAAFGTDWEKLIWDMGTNGIGSVSTIAEYSTGSTVATTLSRYTHDLQGREGFTYETFNGLPNARQIQKTFTLGGSIADYYYYEYPRSSGTDGSYAKWNYDARGFPYSISLSPWIGGPAQTIGVQTRNLAGLVTKRHTDTSVGPMTYVESNWTYDSLGRVQSQTVLAGPAATQVARQDLTYFGNDDPATLDHWLGSTNHKHFTYGYDQRHQLISVSETKLPNAFTAQYSYNAAGRFVERDGGGRSTAE